MVLGVIMQLFLSNPRGFCAGVVRAINTVEQALKIWGAPIYVKHQIVHNRHVVEDLQQKGAIFVEDLDRVPRGCRIIYSAHGVPPSVKADAKRRKLIEIDASCGLVIRVHSAAKHFASKGYHILLIGHRKHVEVVGTAGEAPESITIIESIDDVKRLCFSSRQKLFYVTQTTLSVEEVTEITNAMRAKYPHIETLLSSSICYATTNRQLALKALTRFVDVVFVIGDPNSSNSNRLCEVARKQGIPSYLINNPCEINPMWLRGVETIGLTAGASTPEFIVQKCVAYLRTLGVTAVEEFKYAEEKVLFQLPKEVW